MTISFAIFAAPQCWKVILAVNKKTRLVEEKNVILYSSYPCVIGIMKSLRRKEQGKPVFLNNEDFMVLMRFVSSNWFLMESPA